MSTMSLVKISISHDRNETSEKGCVAFIYFVQLVFTHLKYTLV